MYNIDDLDFIKFAEIKGLEYLSTCDDKNNYAIVYVYLMLNKSNQYVYFIHQTVHIFTAEDEIINFSFHRNIFLDAMGAQNKYYVNIRNLITEEIESTFLFEDIVNEFSNLSSREKEIANLIINGVSGRQIAEKLFISYNTVRTHRKNILRKTECKSGLELLSKFKRERKI